MHVSTLSLLKRQRSNLLPFLNWYMEIEEGLDYSITPVPDIVKIDVFISPSFI